MFFFVARTEFGDALLMHSNTLQSGIPRVKQFKAVTDPSDMLAVSDPSQHLVNLNLFVASPSIFPKTKIEKNTCDRKH